MTEIPAKLRKHRRQLEIQDAHEPGVAREIRFQAPSNDPNGTTLDGLIILNREGSNKPIYLIRSLDSIPVCSATPTAMHTCAARTSSPSSNTRR